MDDQPDHRIAAGWAHMAHIAADLHSLTHLTGLPDEQEFKIPLAHSADQLAEAVRRRDIDAATEILEDLGYFIAQYRPGP